MKLSEIFQKGLNYAIEYGMPWYMCIRLREIHLFPSPVEMAVNSAMMSAGISSTLEGCEYAGVDDYFEESGLAAAYKMNNQEMSKYGRSSYAMWVQFWFFVIFDLARKGQ
ncbi:hypothetical protein VIPPAEUMC01_00113 [Pseudomonas phage vB_VIPPAEUMC01]|uniref:Uncharacterized protein n=1 Tax=Pseudomonas phage vB_VIPPAEUMC01 TaxID=3034284 RepID=A0AAF0FTR9_9CAUD|nr:hypothetical protein VIPPAEUMC01_00113 [Pseudomonas phage vB_VIPPAEUMC01]